MAARRYEFATITVQNTIVKEVNGQGVDGAGKPLHSYLTEQSKEGWKMAGMAGSGAPLVYWVILKKRIEDKPKPKARPRADTSGKA